MDRNTSHSNRGFKQAVIICFLSLVIFMICSTFYSLLSGAFSTGSSPFSLSVIGELLGIFVFIIVCFIAALRFFSLTQSGKSHSSPFSLFNDEVRLGIHDHEPYRPEDHRYNDWHNDVTNPSSPTYAAFKRLHHYDD